MCSPHGPICLARSAPQLQQCQQQQQLQQPCHLATMMPREDDDGESFAKGSKAVTSYDGDSLDSFHNHFKGELRRLEVYVVESQRKHD